MNIEQAKIKIDKLKKEIDNIRYHYHVLDELIVPEGVKDSLQHELELLEQEFPQLITPDSPTQRVAGEPLSRFIKVEHKEPMISLSDSFSKEELEKWETRNKKLVNKPYSYFAELKIDGFAVSLIYENGIFVKGATRGNGKTGEDITQNLKTLESIPLKLKSSSKININQRVEVRGEVYLSKKEFERINKEQEQKKLPKYANPRNLAAGTMRQLDSKITSSRKLDSFMYELITDLGAKNHSEKHELIKELGFKTSQYVKKCRSINEVYEYATEWEPKRNKLPFLVDGMVVLIDSLEIENILGTVGKTPRWATAYKFAPEQSTTVVEDIKVSLGRTGALTPFAILRPVRIAGSTVRRATLHNEDEIRRKDIRIGDTVIIQKAGDIIPEIVKPIKKIRVGNEKKFIMPKICPICGGRVIKPAGEAIARCANTKCWAQEKEKIIHFVSKEAFNIEGMGEQIVEQFIENGLIKDPSDLFMLKEEDIEGLERFAKKSAENIIKSINSHKEITLSKFIYALGIRHVGIQTANMIAAHFNNLDNLKKSTIQELLNLNDIGPVSAKSISSWFLNKDNLNMINNLLKNGVVVKKEKTTSKLKNKSFVITGSLERYSREALEDIIRKNGGTASSSVTKNTDFLILGENPGSKYEKAQNLNIKIISEDKFLKMI
jgi:DNA ligase (NAD+)